MNILGLVLLPILLCFNSYFLGKLFTIKHKTLFNSYSFIAGFFTFILIVCFASIPFIIVDTLNQFYWYFLVIFQIILIVLYLINWKKSIFCLLINWYKIIYFISFIIIAIGIYLAFYFSYYEKFIVNGYNYLQNSNKSVLRFFLIKWFNLFNVNIQYFYKIVLPSILILFLSTLVISFFKIKNQFSFKKYIISIALLMVLSSILFFDYRNIINFNSMLFIAIFFISNFLITKYSLINFKNNYFIYNLSLFYLVFLNSNFILYAIIAHLLFIISSYSMRNEFSLDGIIKSSIHFLLLVIISIIDHDLFILGIIFAIFVFLLIIFTIISKEEKYFNFISKIEQYLMNKMKYVLLICSLITTGIILILILGNNYKFDLNIFKISDFIWNNPLFVDIVQITFYVIYGIIVGYGLLYFFITFKNHENFFGKKLVLAVAILTMYNPLTISLISYLTFLFSFDNKIIFLILFILFYFIICRSLLNYDKSHYENLNNKQNLKNKFICNNSSKILFQFSYYLFLLCSIILVAGPLAFSYF